MFKRDQVLKSPYDFHSAIFFSIPVSVWQDGQIVDYGGFIESHNENSVIISLAGAANVSTGAQPQLHLSTIQPLLKFILTGQLLTKIGLSAFPGI